jgi:hypothetical protein
MGEDRFNVLMLLYVHNDIEIDISKVVEMYSRQYPKIRNQQVHVLTISAFVFLSRNNNGRIIRFQ